MHGRAKRRVGIAIKALVSLGLVGVLVWHVGTGELAARLMSVSRWAIAGTIAVFAVNVLLVTPRWAEILSGLDSPIPARRLLAAVMMGFLLNQALPTSVGGDVWRGWYAHALGAPLRTAFESVIIDRAFGVISLGIGLLVLLPFHEALTADPVLSWVLYGATALVFLAIAAAFIVRSVPVIRIPVIASVQGALRDLAASLIVILLAPGRNLLVLGLSLAGQLIPIAAMAILAWALGLDLSLLDIAVVTMASMLLATIPLSLGGWGIRESAIVVLLAKLGISTELSLSLSLLYGGCLTLAALPGAFAMLGSKRPQLG